MTELYSKDNLFTAFNNIEKIKKEKGLKQMIRVEEMIRTIKDRYNLNAPMLAHNLGVNVQSVYKWENGGRPNITSYNKIKELYEEITKEIKEEALEQPETVNKEVVEDITAGTPFIEVTSDFDYKKIYINIYNITEIRASNDGAHIFNDGNTFVKEAPVKVLELIRKKLKENEKN